MLPSGPHDEFLELCAVSTSGHLSDAEQKRLQEHLAICSECRDALRDFESVVHDTIPAIGAEQASEQSSRIDPGPGFSQSKAEKAFFERLAREEGEHSAAAEKKNGVPRGFRRILPIAPESTWRHVWMLYAAGILLFITLAFSAYRIGIRQGTEVARRDPAGADPQSVVATQSSAPLEEQLSDAAHEREIARAQIAQRDQALLELHRQLVVQAAEIRRLEEARQELEKSLLKGDADEQSLTRQREDLGQKLGAAQAESQALRQRVDTLTQQSNEGIAQAAALGTRVNDLTRLLHDRDAALLQQERLLSHDQDLRELMGARDLYIAEVYDVADNGATRKPYGRVFYTRGKSLVFYAYDLDQDETRRARSFQVWGRRGPDFQQALNLGIFNEDNASKKRWILKLDDPGTLAQIDAVFVTVEPRGGSEKPSGKPLLFAYLRVNPNHP
ncbi:MAG: zf-HC2 domain-containing protein [Acidobacteria bacterium]|nr:zf-HC2 domain-containing protein [Acidobacteriota bacterium]